ncbi:type II toxin-antitoxin system PemK/MazF family toxin [Paratractidigestivibacter sp.]
MMCEQGELSELDFDPTFGHGPAKLRPALVVSHGLL